MSDPSCFSFTASFRNFLAFALSRGSSGSVKPSVLRSRECAQCILDVINFEPLPVKEGEVEEGEKEDTMLVYCPGRETCCEARDGVRNCFGHTILEPRVSV